jgi:hypothetical protein
MIIRVFTQPSITARKRSSRLSSRHRRTARVTASRLAEAAWGRSLEPPSNRYLYVTVWKDVESIQAFAGSRWREAVITPEEAHLLTDTSIEHYEVLHTSD